MHSHGFAPTRREFIKNASAGFAGAGLNFRFPGVFSAKRSAEPLLLGSEAAKKNLLFGFALDDSQLSNPAYAALAASQCTIVTPANAMKWKAIHPAPDHYAFDRADAIVRFAESKNIKVRGHCFCWHRALPQWVGKVLTKDNAEAALRQHIETVAGRYKDRLHSWDVVNEAIHLPDNHPNGWRDSFWYRLLGPSYVDIAYDQAHKTDPTAILTYNDWGLEYQNYGDISKRKAVLAMLRDLKKRGVPVGALGLQSHLRAGTGENFGYDLPKFIAEVRDLGLEIFLTELDVDDSHLTVEGAERDDAVADVYKRYLEMVLGTGAVRVVITWGVWDVAKPTGAEEVSGPKAQRPLLFAPDTTPKTDAYAVARSFERARFQH